MPRQQKDVTYDHDMRLKDAGALTADGASQVGGSPRVLDLGQGRVDGRVIIDLTAVTVGADHEALIVAQFSSSPTFASGNVSGTAVHVGDATITGQSVDSVLGRYELPFTNEINGVVLRYMRLWNEVRGTTPSINYVAFAALKA